MYARRPGGKTRVSAGDVCRCPLGGSRVRHGQALKKGERGSRTRTARVAVVARAVSLVLLLLATGGCLYTPAPTTAFPASSAEVREAWSRLVQDPKRLERPVVVIDGWIPLGGGTIVHALRRLTGADRDDILVITYWPGRSFESLARTVVEQVEERWPHADSVWTREVDVVGFSAGGIVARQAAAEPEGDDERKRLRIARLFTISAPHRGTICLARALAPDAASRTMRPGSPTLARLDEALADDEYELICYGQTNDHVVGAQHAAPPGMEPYWTGGRFIASHSSSARNQRFLLDIALRLRGEPPIGVEASRPPRQ